MNSVDPVRNDVSVVIVNYNAGRALLDCVNSVMPQVEEVIVVDNDSADKSLEWLEQECKDDSRLKIIRNGANLGFSAGCNVGLQEATGKFILFYNPDCLTHENTVRRLVEVLVSDNSIGMTGGLLLNEDGSEQPGGRRAVPTPWRSLVRVAGLTRFSKRWPKLFFDFHLHEQPLPDEPIDVEAISGACMLVKREAVEDVGVWDEDYFLHCEDLDWSMRFRLNGWRILFVPDAKVTHLLGVCSKDRKIFVEWHKHKGMMRFYKKFFKSDYPGVLMWFVALGIWTRFALVALVQKMRDLTRAFRKVDA